MNTDFIGFLELLDKKGSDRVGIMSMSTWEARKLVWEGAIPLQIHLHESEVTIVPSPTLA